MKKQLFMGLSLCLAMATQGDLGIDEIIASYKQDSAFWIKPHLSDDVEFRELEALPQMPPYPNDNPHSKEKVELGKKLFNDPKLSLSNQIACSNCHDEELGFGDGRSVSYGHDRQKGKRNSPSITMSAFGKEKFWDGRAKDLESQALMPIADPVEMAYNAELAAKKLNKIQEYKELFKGAFGTDEITKELIAKALATYERSTMRTTRFDRFMKGDKSMLSDKEIYGMHIFRTKGRCINCHNGVEFSDSKYHNLGLTYYGRKYEDLGRYEVTKNADDVGKFKTPSLRGVSRSAPYMHNGLFPNLRGIINMYNVGMFRPEPKDEAQKNDPLFPKTSHLLQKLDLNKEEIDALEAFLKVL